MRYADDCNIYVRSEKADHRVMTSMTRFIEGRLKLQVNAQKSAVARHRITGQSQPQARSSSRHKHCQCVDGGWLSRTNEGMWQSALHIREPTRTIDARSPRHPFRVGKDSTGT